MKHSKRYLKKKLRDLDRKLHYLGLSNPFGNEWKDFDLRRKEIRNLIKYYNRTESK